MINQVLPFLPQQTSQQQQGAYLPPPSKPPPPPPTWTPSGYTQGVNSPVLPRWSPGTIPGTQGPASPATGSHHHQQQLFYQHQRQQQQQQEMLHHPMPSPRPYPPPSASQLMQQVSRVWLHLLSACRLPTSHSVRSFNLLLRPNFHKHCGVNHELLVTKSIPLSFMNIQRMHFKCGVYLYI